MKLELIKYLNENNISLGRSENNSELKFISESMGYGKFATKEIKKDEIIYRFGGMWLSLEERMMFDQDYFHRVDGGFFFQGGLSPTLNGTHNHSCSPTAYVEDFTIRALRDILLGEQITVDYSSFVVHDHDIFASCKCGSTECRGKVTGYDWKLFNLAKKYNNRVSSQVRRLTEEYQKTFDNHQDSL